MPSAGARDLGRRRNRSALSGSGGGTPVVEAPAQTLVGLDPQTGKADVVVAWRPTWSRSRAGVASDITTAATHRLADDDLDRGLARAARLSGRARLDAYSRLDERLARDVAALIPIGRYDQLDSFSERIGCQTFHRLYGMILGALCFRS